MRQVRNRVDAALHFIDELINIDIKFGLEVHITDALSRNTRQAFEAVDISDNFFQADDDLVFDILRRGPWPGD